MKKIFVVQIEVDGIDEETINHDIEAYVSIEDYHCKRTHTFNSTSIKGWKIVGKSPENYADLVAICKTMRNAWSDYLDNPDAIGCDIEGLVGDADAILSKIR